MKKVKVEILKPKQASGYTLSVEDEIVGGCQSGFGYDIVQSFFIDASKLLQLIGEVSTENITK